MKIKTVEEMMKRKLSEKLNDQFYAHKYFRDLNTSEQLKVYSSITDYNDLNHIYTPSHASYAFHKFFSDNYGDDTIIQAVTGYVKHY